MNPILWLGVAVIAWITGCNENQPPQPPNKSPEEIEKEVV
jgi:hypothetical protein